MAFENPIIDEYFGLPGSIKLCKQYNENVRKVLFARVSRILHAMHAPVTDNTQWTL